MKGHLFDYSQPFVNSETGFLTQRSRYALEQIERAVSLVGSGSPEGVVDAPQYSEYIDKDGSTGSLKYIKIQASISGDTTQGWVAI